MKRSFLILCLALVGLSVAAPKGEAMEKWAGIGAGVCTHCWAPQVGVFFRLEPWRHVRFGADVGYQFTKHRSDAFRFNLDVQSPWAVEGGHVSVYPLVGLNVSRWNLPGNRKDDRVGFNVGGGVDWRPLSRIGLKFFVEGKYMYNRDHETGVIEAGIGYVF